MRKKLLLFAGAATVLLGLVLFNPFRSENEGEEMEENESETLKDRYLQEFEQLRDPALNEIPTERLLVANEATRTAQRAAVANRTAALNWQERGPVYDLVGPSNPNTRAGGEYTAGVVETFLVDFNADPAGNVVFAGSPSGGLWRCTNFLSATAANWQPVNDFQSNLAIASICQDPSSPNIMYLATGDAGTVALSDGVRGYGIWKSTNSGLNWTLLTSTTTYQLAFKILCDNTGNVYLATGGGGLRRSIDGGLSWTTITPSTAASVASNSSYVTDLEISSTGRLHAIFGYAGTRVRHFYTDNPSTVTAALGWTLSSGIRLSTTSCSRIEIATQGDLLYAVTANSTYNVDSCYKSIDGGNSWTLQNTAGLTTNIANGQAWYALTLGINPDDPNDVIVGSVDAYRSTNSGSTFSRATYWVGSTAPYVHADHHVMRWFKVGAENRIIIGSDGGMFMSRNGGAGFVDRNQNLAIKQFYSCSSSPIAGENYLIAGAQDNGCHQLTNPGLSSSTEFYGGDGGYVHINQQNKQIQFGSYVYNVYRRSTNGGATWGSVTLNANSGYFINPFDYDDALNTMYASNAATTANNQIRRWSDANTTNASTVLTVDELTRSGTASNASAFKVSPYAAKRVFIGSNRGSVLRLDNASTVSSSTEITANIADISSSSFPVGYINCVNTGSSDNALVATFTNYGVSNVWVSTNGGAAWTAVDGNLPDMPVWWAVFYPGNDSKMIIATEAGVYTTDALNGAATVWTPEPSFPVVRTRMLKIRQSDNTIVAATYGRGLWTAPLNSCSLATISTQPVSQTICPGGSATFSVTASGTALTYQWRKDGNPISGATGVSYVATVAGTYDVVITNSCGGTTSTSAILTISSVAAITSQPISQTGCPGGSVTFSVSASGSNLTYQWRKGGINIAGATGSNIVLSSLTAADAGTYDVVVSSSCGSPVTSSAVTLTLNAATVINSQQSTQAVCVGSNASFSVNATGTGTLTYQWKKDGVNITGATSNTYTIASTVLADAGNYTVTVTSDCGSVTSSPAALTVNTGGACVTAVPNVDPDVQTLVLMPNAVRQSTVLRIKVQRPMKVDWIVVDAKGSIVMSFAQKLTTGQTDLTLQFGKLAAGVYHLYGTTEKGKLGTVRFVKI